MGIDFNKLIEEGIERFYNDIISTITNKISYGPKSSSTGNTVNLDVLPGKPIDEPKGNNLYMIFHKLPNNQFELKYVGKKQNGEMINTRLKYHLVDNPTLNKKNPTHSIISKLLNKYLVGRSDEIYYHSAKINPDYMVGAVESYLILKYDPEWNHRNG